jgi:predicted flap endonuclease-1-like 5' DNA nuclease
MIYLLAKYTILFLLAAILGFILGYWWSRRRMVDVTESYEDLRRAIQPTDETNWDRLWTSIDGLSGGLAPVERRLHKVEAELFSLGKRIATSHQLEQPVQQENSPARQKAEMPRLLESASYGPKDDLKRISGIGPKLEQLLNENGIFYYWQVASWSDQDVVAIDEQLDVFKGRIARDDWVTQASQLKEAPDAARMPADEL